MQKYKNVKISTRLKGCFEEKCSLDRWTIAHTTTMLCAGWQMGTLANTISSSLANCAIATLLGVLTSTFPSSVQRWSLRQLWHGAGVKLCQAISQENQHSKDFLVSWVNKITVASLGRCGVRGRQYWLVHDSELWWPSAYYKRNYISEKMCGVPHKAPGGRTPMVNEILLWCCQRCSCDVPRV